MTSIIGKNAGEALLSRKDRKVEKDFVDFQTFDMVQKEASF